MEARKIKIVLIAAFLLIVAGIFVTRCDKSQAKPENSIADTLFLSQWRKEKIEKQNLIDQYEHRIQDLLMTRDSLLMEVAQKKKVMTNYRFKEKSLQDQLKEVVTKAQIPDSIKSSIAPLIDSLVITSDKGDTACNETIEDLENIIQNRDSVIDLHIQVENNLKDIQKSQELKDLYLTEQLDHALKTQRKAARRNKLLSGGLLILSGVTASLLITQSLK